MPILTNGAVCCYSSCDEDAAIKAKHGWCALTESEISVAGMVGFEHIVSPLNTTINADGSITFTPPALPSDAELFDRLRIATEQRLSDTDKYATVDYPDSAHRDAVLIYRAELRAINRQSGAPWDGGGERTPWPANPEI